jgi:RNA polymerase sigma-70 factor (ECF subfamily)
VSKECFQQDGDDEGRGSLQTIQDAVNKALSRLLDQDDPDRDDLRQTAIEAVLSTLNRGRFRGDCSLTGWVSVIVRNVVNDALRGRIRARRLFASSAKFAADERFEMPDLGRSQGLSEACHDLVSIDGILERLDPIAASVIYLYDVLGYDLPEIAPIVGLSIGAAQSRLVRTRRRIVTLLKRREAVRGDPGLGPAAGVQAGRLGRTLDRGR